MTACSISRLRRNARHWRGFAVVAAVSFVLPVALANAAAHPTLAMPGCPSTGGTPGQRVCLPVTLVTNGQSVASVDFKLSYDLAVQRLPSGAQDVERGSALTGGQALLTQVSEDLGTGVGHLQVAITAPIQIPTPLISDGVLCNVCFTVKPAAPNGCSAIPFLANSVSVGDDLGRDLVVDFPAPGGLHVSNGVDPTPTMPILATSTFQATPATATPTPTAAIPSATSTPVSTATVSGTPTIIPTPVASPLALSRKDVTKCQNEIKKAGGTFVSNKLQHLANCANRILRCIQTQDDGKDACLTKARTACNKELDKLGDTDLRNRISKGCRLLTTSELKDAAAGLGYDNLALPCGSQPLDDVAAIVDCISRQHECLTARLFEVQQPRATELLGSLQLPENVLDRLCLTEQDGNGLSVGSTSDGKVIAKCAATIAKAGATFAGTKLKNVQKCVGAAFKCLESAPTSAQRIACLGKADATCDVAFATIEGGAPKLRSAIDKRCGTGAIAYSVLRAADAANLDALGPECARYGIASLGSLGEYEACVLRQHECRGADLLRVEIPRIDELLGMVNRPPIGSATCPPSSAAVVP